MMFEDRRVELPEVGVKIKVPAQAKRIGVRTLPVGDLKDMKSKPGGFRPARLVANFELFDEDQPDEFLAEFDPPFELEVRYTKGDFQKAEKAGKPLQLAFWDGSDWILFTKEKHQFELIPDDPPGAGGVGVAKISRWGDPPVSWG